MVPSRLIVCSILDYNPEIKKINHGGHGEHGEKQKKVKRILEFGYWDLIFSITGLPCSNSPSDEQ